MHILEEISFTMKIKTLNFDLFLFRPFVFHKQHRRQICLELIFTAHSIYLFFISLLFVVFSFYYLFIFCNIKYTISIIPFYEVIVINSSFSGFSLKTSKYTFRSKNFRLLHTEILFDFFALYRNTKSVPPPNE